MKTRYTLLIGATGGIGKAIAQHLVDDDTPLILAARSETKLLALQKNLLTGRPDRKVRYQVLDLNSPQSRQTLLQEIESNGLEISTVINNAGINEFSFFKDQSDEDIAGQLQTNLLGPAFICKDFINYFLNHDIAGQIINIGSTFGSIAYPGFASYSASKFALRGLTEALSREYADSPLRIRYFAPRATKTTMNNDVVTQLNQELKVAMDDPADVAANFMHFMKGNKQRQFLGWPEKLFVFINAISPDTVSNALQKTLPTVKKYLAKATGKSSPPEVAPLRKQL